MKQLGFTNYNIVIHVFVIQYLQEGFQRICLFHRKREDTSRPTIAHLC